MSTFELFQNELDLTANQSPGPCVFVTLNLRDEEIIELHIHSEKGSSTLKSCSLCQPWSYAFDQSQVLAFPRYDWYFAYVDGYQPEYQIMVLKIAIMAFDKAQGCRGSSKTDITGYMGARAGMYLMHIGCYSSGSQCLGWEVFATDVH